MSSLEERCYAALNRLAKWRNVFAGWQLGTRLDTDPECKAIKDHREVTILLRVEVTALTKILLDAGVMTQEDWQDAMLTEAELLNQDYENRFPGMKATDIGIQYDRRAAETMKDWKP